MTKYIPLSYMYVFMSLYGEGDKARLCLVWALKHGLALKVKPPEEGGCQKRKEARNRVGKRTARQNLFRGKDIVKMCHEIICPWDKLE